MKMILRESSCGENSLFDLEMKDLKRSFCCSISTKVDIKKYLLRSETSPVSATS